MIKGIHAMIYSPAADQVRNFFRDVLGFSYTDTGGGWLIFSPPESEIGCHPSDRTFHEITFYCDDIHKTMDELKRRGVVFSGGVSDEEWGLSTRFKVPGGDEIGLYQPKYSVRTRARPRAQARPRQSRRRSPPTRKRVRS